MKTLRIVLTLIACACMCVISYTYGYEHCQSENQERSDIVPEQRCWGDILMEDYVLDVVDETDFWEVCDSTAFSIYEENTSEWYLAVCLEFARIYK